MKKLLRHLIGWAVALCLLLVAATFIITSQIPKYAAENLSKKLQVPVSVGDMSIWWDHISIADIKIDNLPKSYLPKALEIGKIRIDASPLKYLDKIIHIDTITMDNIYLGLEFDSPKSAKGNWTTLMSNLQASESPTDQESAKSAVIKELVLTNIQVDVVYKSAGGKVKKLPPIPKLVLYNINTDQGLPTEQIMQSVVGKMLQSIFVQENVKNMFEGVLEQPKNAFDTIMSPFKGLF